MPASIAGVTRERLMNAHKVVPHVEQRHGHGVHVVFDLLRKRIRQPSKAPHVHPHREVLALHVKI